MIKEKVYDGTGLYGWSLGIVAEDLDLDNRGYVKIFPKEIFPGHDAELLAEDESSVTIEDSKGNPKIINLEKSVTVTARWLKGSGSTRHTPPVLRKGESVYIKKVRGTDQYFWTELENEPDIRRKEPVLNMITNTDDFAVMSNKDNTYYTVIDTVNKFLQVKTNINDGEVAGFNFVLNTKTGIFRVEDTNGNFIDWNVPENRFLFNIPNMEFVAVKRFMVKSPGMKFIGKLIHFVSGTFKIDVTSGGGAFTSINPPKCGGSLPKPIAGSGEPTVSADGGGKGEFELFSRKAKYDVTDNIKIETAMMDVRITKYLSYVIMRASGAISFAKHKIFNNVGSQSCKNCGVPNDSTKTICISCGATCK